MICGARLALGAALLAVAAAPRPAILITNAWTRPTPIAGLNAAGYLTIANNRSRAERLVSASSPAAASVTLHKSAKVGQVMTMRQVPFIAIPAHGAVSLSPGGYHLMLERVRRPLRVGERVPLTLRFADGISAPVTLSVRAGADAMPGMAM